MSSGNRADRFGVMRNYERLGRAQLGVARAFIAAGGRDLTTTELLEWTHARALHREAYRGYIAADRFGDQPLALRFVLAGATLMASFGGCAYRMLTRIANNTVSG